MVVAAVAYTKLTPPLKAEGYASVDVDAHNNT